MMAVHGSALMEQKIIWRASRPKTEAEIKEYKDLLAENLVAPTNMEVWIANADGSNAQQVTILGAGQLGA